MGLEQPPTSSQFQEVISGQFGQKIELATPIPCIAKLLWSKDELPSGLTTIKPLLSVITFWPFK